MKISVIGQGYVGLSLALAAEKAGHQVLGFDINTELISELNNQKSHIEGISDLDLKEASNYQASSNAFDINGSEIVIIAVPTPLDSERKPNL